MYRRLILILLIDVFLSLVTFGQVSVRLFSSQSPESAVFSVTEGRYELITFNGRNLRVTKSENVIISRYNGKLAVKTRSENGFICDSLLLLGKTGNDYFSLRINGHIPVRQYYSGDLKCFPDLGTLLLINNCDVESYISGVVKAEGGSGKNKEYFKTQSIIARTYMYKYFDRHLSDRYNVCDNTHCQVFNGLSSDTIINKAALETKRLVILSRDSTIISSAFHSNCGGETSTSEDVWLASQPYLKSVADPYCLSSRNARWEKRLSMDEWFALLKRLGYEGQTIDPAAFIFIQNSRRIDYRTGSFKIPLGAVRSEMNLRSTFFSVLADGDSILLRGRGYGHGVGLCQEGAMSMAEKGFNWHQIIDFYYFNVLITDIKYAVILPNQPYRASFTSQPPLRNSLNSPQTPSLLRKEGE
jgi:stage II sporulation protein D